MEVAVIGCGGHARSVADVICNNEEDWRISFYDNEAREGELLLGRYKVYPLKTLDLIRFDGFFAAIGDNKKRADFIEQQKEYCDKLMNVVSSTAHIGSDAVIEKGTFVGDGAHIGPEAYIGTACIVNTGAIIEHEVSIGRYSHVSVNATLCGRCNIGANAFVGAGATVIDTVTICDDVTIGAGAVVVDDIKEHGIYAGIPAKRVR